MGNQAYLSAAEKRDVMELVAGKGENYQRYLEWCDRTQVPPARRWTELYFHKWVSRRRDQIRVLTEAHRVEIRKSSVFDKQKRLDMLEGSVERLRGLLESGEELTVADILRLEEQLGKMLDRIARERGEYGKSAPDSDSMADLNKALANEAIEALKRSRMPALPEAVVEGQYREVAD